MLVDDVNPARVKMDVDNYTAKGLGQIIIAIWRTKLVKHNRHEKYGSTKNKTLSAIAEKALKGQVISQQVR